MVHLLVGHIYFGNSLIIIHNDIVRYDYTNNEVGAVLREHKDEPSCSLIYWKMRIYIR